MKVEEHESLVKMSLKMVLQLFLIFLLMISGALGNQWSVKYSKLHLCAVKGSTVVMEATYTHPTGVTVINRFWFINPVTGVEVTDLRNESGYSGRVEYLGDKQNHFSLRLSDVKKSDEHMYCFRFRTTKDKYQGVPGITLRVTDLQLIAPAEVTEGESVILTCKTTCSLTDPTFIWYKNTHDLTTNTFKSNEFHLQRVSSEDAGSAVRGSEHLPSPAQYLSVRYPPKNMSISPSGANVVGCLVILTCSSNANPPVETYTWFKENEASHVGSGQSYRALQSGLYYCEVQNKLGSERSAAVSITINGGCVIVNVAAGLGIFALGALLSAPFWLRCRRQKKKADEGDHQNIGLSAKDDTYAALDPAGRKSDDVYHTLAISHPRPADVAISSN
ncbi:cell adhesion molecule 2-like [Silurus meridionalis]|uniref:cell adhesion molecule 2-like n=1 Tax=Silurus meridionalis TaxID=175797 RepID=UPI001EEBB4EA|nr:cell adhesion molecule 2-like [Silurus meridionalis]